MKKWMVSILVVALSIGMFICQGWLMSREGFTSIRTLDADYWWIVTDEEQVPRDEADQLIAADGMIFLHYEYYGYVNAYRSDGTFVRGYQVATGKGRGEIAYADGILYIDGQSSGIYQFRGEEMVGFEEQSRKNPDYRMLENRMSESQPVVDNGYTYYYNAEAGQITRAMPGQPLETVVRLPVKDGNVDALAFANIALWAMFALWFKDDGKLPGWAQAYHERKKRLH